MSKRILVVDDDPMIRALVCDCLGTLGVELNAVENGTSCLAALTQTENRPDLIVLDLIMPDMSGLDVLKKIRGDASLASIPVLMLTANSDTAEVAASMNISANEYLGKPFAMMELIGTVVRLTTP